MSYYIKPGRTCCSSAAPVPAAAHQFVENCIASALTRCSTGVAIEESICTDKVETSEVL